MLRCGLPLRGSPAPILCLNIHSLNFKLGLAGYGSQLDSILAAAAAHHGPVIFSGDFNTWSRWRMELLQRKMAAAGLRRVEFAGEGPLPSWFSARSLDHVFYSHGRLRADPASARILAEIRSSDHAPLVVDFLP
jgi:endonuclease/exonuclease/phosphatase (EEP) superfamily protein YafD